MFTPLLGWLLLLLLRTACQSKPVDDTAIQQKPNAVAFRPLPTHQLTERANLLRLNVQQLIRDFVDPLSELIEAANNGDVESRALRLQVFIEQNSTYFQQMLGWLKFLAANISDTCKHKRMRNRCQQWWLSYRYAMRTNVNAGAWPVRMNHVQFFKEWEWKLDWLLAMVSAAAEKDREQQTDEPPAGGYGKLLEWIRWAGTPPVDAEEEETEGNSNGTDNEVLSVTDQRLTSSAEDGWEAAGHPVKVLYNVFYPNDVEPLYHAEIQVHGVVYSFGNKYGISIYDQQKRKEQNVREKTEVFETYLGSTQFGPAQVQAIIDDLTVSGFAGYQYELVNHSCQHFAGAFVDRLLGDRRIRDWPPVLHPYTTLSENTAIIEAFKKTLDPDEKEDDEEEE